jgi:DNA-directed RNA polymerase subunit RPC12/RpoP
MDLKKLTVRQAAELVRQLEQDGIDCPNCNKKLSVTDLRCPNCGYVLSKAPLFTIRAIIAGVVIAGFLVVYIIGLF